MQPIGHLDYEEELGQERESDVRIARPEEAQRLEISLLYIFIDYLSLMFQLKL